MIPLAVSGPVVIGVVVAAALLLIVVLLRAEDRTDAQEAIERKAREGADRDPHGPAGP
jgi:hypothetical protein